MSILGLKILFLLRINWLKQHIYTMKFVLPECLVMMLIVLRIYNFSPGLRAPYCEYMCTDQLQHSGLVLRHMRDKETKHAIRSRAKKASTFYMRALYYIASFPQGTSINDVPILGRQVEHCGTKKGHSRQVGCPGCKD